MWKSTWSDWVVKTSSLCWYTTEKHNTHSHSCARARVNARLEHLFSHAETLCTHSPFPFWLSLKSRMNVKQKRSYCSWQQCIAFTVLIITATRLFTGWWSVHKQWWWSVHKQSVWKHWREASTLSAVYTWSWFLCCVLRWTITASPLFLHEKHSLEDIRQSSQT